MSSLVAPRVVLVVEDDGILRYAIVQALRAAGCEVVESDTAEDAIDHVDATRRIDVVFTDIQLADRLTGWDVADQFRAADVVVLIIYTSGNALDRSRRVADGLFFRQALQHAGGLASLHRVNMPVLKGQRKCSFLHILSGGNRVVDPDGEDFADLASAKLERSKARAN